MKKRIVSILIIILISLFIYKPIFAYTIYFGGRESNYKHELLNRLGFYETKVFFVKRVICNSKSTRKGETIGCASQNKKNNLKVIQIKKGLPKKLTEYVMYHEIGHLLLVYNKEANKIYNNDKEAAADGFADYMTGTPNKFMEKIFTNRIKLYDKEKKETKPIHSKTTQNKKSRSKYERSVPSFKRSADDVWLFIERNQRTRKVQEWLRTRPLPSDR